MSGGRSLKDLALLIPVLFFHELGHWAGMRLFGFRDVKMFFIPFFGAAVSGRGQGVASWKEALGVLLATEAEGKFSRFKGANTTSAPAATSPSDTPPPSP